MPDSNATDRGPGILDYQLGDESVLYLEDRAQLILLNATASLIWRGLEAGLTPDEIIRTLADNSGAPRVDVARDVNNIIQDWLRNGIRGHGSDTRMGTPDQADRENLPENPVYLDRDTGPAYCKRGYQLVDFSFELETPNPEIDELADQLLQHLAVTHDAGSRLKVIEEPDRLVLLRDGALVDVCDSNTGFGPMLHANVLMMAYEASDCMMAVHAAALAQDGQCILLPAVAGSGKTTLAAALLARGFGYCTDDLALLTGPPIRIRAVPVCMGLKEGAWSVLSGDYPQLSKTREYLREDGQRIRYLRPPAGSVVGVDAPGLTVSHIIFPEFRPNAETRIQSISSADGLVRLTNAGYDFPGNMNQSVIEALIDWISATPCYQLQFADSEQAAQAISGAVS